MSQDSTAAVRPETTFARRLLDSAIMTSSKEPLAGIIELRTDGGHIELKIDQDTALTLLTDLERFLTQ